MLYGAVRAVLPKIKSGVAMNEVGFMKSGGFVFELKLVRVTPLPHLPLMRAGPLKSGL